MWPHLAALDRTPESLATSPGAVAPGLSPHYWRALGHLAGRYWYDTERSLSLLNAHLQVFVPRLDPTVQRSFLQGVGQVLFTLPYPFSTHWVAPVELERFPHAYQSSLLEGWGMKLGELDLVSGFPWQGHESPFWMAWAKGLTTKSLASIQQGKTQFEALFEGGAPSALEPARHTP